MLTNALPGSWPSKMNGHLLEAEWLLVAKANRVKRGRQVTAAYPQFLTLSFGLRLFSCHFQAVSATSHPQIDFF